jgi:DNA invertase Pin-like site-specific DNA recombinase
MQRKRASIYLRVEPGREKELEEQKNAIESAFKNMDYKLVRVYQDVRRGDNLDRDGINALMIDARNGNIDAVFVESGDRLSDKTNDMTELLELLTAQSIWVYSVKDARFLNRPDVLNNLSRQIYNTLVEMQQNGIDLSKETQKGNQSGAADPTLGLQGKIVEAYLQLNSQNQTQI